MPIQKTFDRSHPFWTSEAPDWGAERKLIAALSKTKKTKRSSSALRGFVCRSKKAPLLRTSKWRASYLIKCVRRPPKMNEKVCIHQLHCTTRRYIYIYITRHPKILDASTSSTCQPGRSSTLEGPPGRLAHLGNDTTTKEANE